MIRLSVVEEVQDVLVGHLAARTAWDEAPALFTIHEQDDGPVLVAVPVPAFLWESAEHPPTAVFALAYLAPQLPRRPDGTHMLVVGEGPLIGVAFRYEAYAISEDNDHPAAREAACRRTAGGSTPRFEDIPGRIEQRCITAIDTDGGRYMASSSRLSERSSEALEPKITYLAFSDPARHTLTGNVVDATNRFLNAIKPIPRKTP
ncbi:hypothetical protein ABZX56_11115 [Streptomyces parvulus]|uniref:hypothetical protein n=1 Tax=Streptomyces parvulus TaxID=146923 RepID=UPI0033B5FB1D